LDDGGYAVVVISLPSNTWRLSPTCCAHGLGILGGVGCGFGCGGMVDSPIGSSPRVRGTHIFMRAGGDLCGSLSVKSVAATNSATFNIVRDTLDKPIFISASKKTRTVRSEDFGKELCLPVPSDTAQYLPETAKVAVTGGGYEWQPR
jgi:hypothetical protein